MADSIQLKMKLGEKSAALSATMLSKEDAKAFFRSTRIMLANHLEANTAAAYLLSRDKKTYFCFESIGLDDRARESFDADTLDGEFGAAIASREVLYIRQIPQDTRFTFLVPGGQFVPREIITVPIVAGNEVRAIFSFATVGTFYSHSAELIESVIDTMSARVGGILAFRTIKDMLGTLEQQNRELDAQKKELTAQATELTQQNAELDAQRSQLAEASRLKTSFLSNMSHELRTPLNSIIALSGVLNRRLAKQIPEEELGYLEIVERNGKHLLELINDILDISRIEAGREDVEITEFDVCRVVKELATMLEPLAVQKGIRLIMQPCAESIRIACDESKCRHILQNIIGNAIKFTEEGGVTLAVQQDGRDVEIMVEDTGIGIAREHLAGIFNEFSQADSTTSRRFGGTGLGLAIAKKYAELLGGAIGVESTLGAGSRFTIVLPLRYGGPVETPPAETPAIPIRRPRPVPETGDAEQKTILLIEDSEPAIIQIKDLLEESGHRILVAQSARQAFRLLEETVPDAMILDLMMPEIDGFETLNALRASEKTSNIPVLVLSAKHISKEEMRELKKNHVYQIIQKGGVNRNDLMNVVSNMLHPKVEAEERPSEPKRARADKPLVLVVEDNADNMTTVRALLGKKYSLIEAEDGETAVALAKARMPERILMDIALPGISGIEAFQAIRRAPATQHIPVVALTASVMKQERAGILSHGFNAFIAKPIIADELFKVIREVLYD
jgi:signal transduction histidine kinase/response regulator RpfG family c-di-GMP phosphodiesterase